MLKKDLVPIFLNIRPTVITFSAILKRRELIHTVFVETKKLLTNAKCNNDQRNDNVSVSAGGTAANSYIYIYMCVCVCVINRCVNVMCA